MENQTSVSRLCFSNKNLIFASGFSLPAVRTAAPLQVSRTVLLLGQQFSVLRSDYAALTFISTACAYELTESVLQAPPRWCRHQDDNQRHQQH